MNTFDDLLGVPRSFEVIEAIATAVRRNYGLRSSDRINMVDFLDKVFCQDFPHFAVLPVSSVDINGDKARAEFSPMCIKVREDIYLRASDNSAEENEVVAHEFGHIVLHSRDLPKPLRDGSQERRGRGNVKNMSTEDQADQFKMAFLIPRSFAAENPNPYVISKKLNVTIEMAKLALLYYKVKSIKMEPYRHMDLDCWEPADTP